MRAFLKLTWMQMKLYAREPVALFFTIAFAPLMLILFGFIYGNEPEPIFGGRGTMDVSVPAYIGLIIVTVGLMSIPISTSTARESGILRRYRVTPLRPGVYLISEVVHYYLMTLAGVLLLFFVGRLAYRVQTGGNWLSILLGFTLGSLSTFALGYVIAGLAPTARIAQTVGMVLAFPMIFLSGATIPLQVMPEGVQNFSRYIPLTHVVKLIQGLWYGEPWGDYLLEVAVLVGTLVVCTLIAIRTFRWE